MKRPALNDLMNLRKPVSHIVLLSFSLGATTILMLSDISTLNTPDFLGLFILLLLQLEVFIFTGNILFVSLKFDKSPGEITRIVLIRFMIFIAICLIVALILSILLKFIISRINGEDLSGVIPYFLRYDFRNWFKSTLSGLSAGAIIFIIILWQTSLRREQKLREENLIFLNETLKNQVNPHFLFNSLNTLSSLITSQPDVAEKFIGSLSSIYRYILDNSRKDKVSLNSELKFINDYFDLHRVRDEDKIFLNINAPGADAYSILPVSLQILIENAIKHNMATRESPLTISISIEDRNVFVKNNLQKMATQIKSTGIGLKNLAERVRLITGEELVIEETNDSFIVKVPLLK
jgi:two-component system LytT family sensor kinase